MTERFSFGPIGRFILKTVMRSTRLRLQAGCRPTEIAGVLPDQSFGEFARKCADGGAADSAGQYLPRREVSSIRRRTKNEERPPFGGRSLKRRRGRFGPGRDGGIDAYRNRPSRDCGDWFAMPMP
jgi:hypothetical protein